MSISIVLVAFRLRVFEQFQNKSLNQVKLFFSLIYPSNSNAQLLCILIGEQQMLRPAIG